MGFNFVPPWNQLPDSWEGISDAGIVTDDALQISYKFALTLRNGHEGHINVRLRKATISTVDKAELYFVIDDEGTPFAEAYSWGDFPARTTAVDSWNVAHELPSGDDCILPDALFVGATYDEGGSPYPDDDGGGIPPVTEPP